MRGVTLTLAAFMACHPATPRWPHNKTEMPISRAACPRAPKLSFALEGLLIEGDVEEDKVEARLRNYLHGVLEEIALRHARAIHATKTSSSSLVLALAANGVTAMDGDPNYGVLASYLVAHLLEKRTTSQQFGTASRILFHLNISRQSLRCGVAVRSTSACDAASNSQLSVNLSSPHGSTAAGYFATLLTVEDRRALRPVLANHSVVYSLVFVDGRLVWFGHNLTANYGGADNDRHVGNVAQQAQRFENRLRDTPAGALRHALRLPAQSSHLILVELHACD